MQEAPYPPNEAERQAALDAFGILDTPAEKSFDLLVEAAQAQFDVPIALISLVDRRRQWFKACYGLNVSETGRDISFCAHVILASEPMVVPDATVDPRFQDNPLVTGEPHIRFYAGAPLVTSEGFRIGTLCLLDVKPRQMNEPELQQLKRFAQLAMTQIDFRERALRAAEAEAAARSAELRFQAFMENSPAVAFIKDQYGRYTYTNRCFQDVYFGAGESYMGRSVAEIWPAELADEIVKHDAEVLRTGLSAAFTELVFGVDGQVRTLYVIKFPFQNERGERFIGGVAVDLTERELAREALRRSEERWQLVLQANNDGIWDWDVRTNMGFHSDRFKEMLGYSGDQEPDPTHWEEQLHPEDRERVKQELKDYLERRIPNYSIEYRLKLLDGSCRWLHARAQGVWDSDGRPVRLVGSLTDVTERKELEAELKRKRAELEQRNAALETANSSKSELLSRMSHEFRTPLNAIIGFSQLLCELTELTDEQSEYVAEILKGGRYLLGLINELLDMVRIEAGKLALSMEPVTAADPLKEAIDLIRPLAADRQIEIDADLRAIAEHTVHADFQRVKQAFLNLLSNAIKYNKNRGRVTVRAVVGEDSRLEISFTDTGIGIGADKMHRLFAPFDRLGAEQHGIEGTGLGLALTKRLVEAMNGNLSAQSTEGVGSTFTVSLPLGTAASFADVERQDDQFDEPPAHSRTATVLYIEDNLANLKLVQRILSKRPALRLISAMQGMMGLELAREHKPDCILLDVHLPDMPGGQVLERLKEDSATSAIPVVVLTADATQGQRQRLLDLGAQEYLTKPLDVKQFLSVLDSVLN
jgi:PAS domain S-box-containing protein